MKPLIPGDFVIGEALDDREFGLEHAIEARRNIDWRLHHDWWWANRWTLVELVGYDEAHRADWSDLHDQWSERYP